MTKNLTTAKSMVVSTAGDPQWDFDKSSSLNKK